MAITIRPARPEDQETIVSYIRHAKISPRDLHWQNLPMSEEGSNS
jgi:hypothetical protein